jgi:general secretion pathway protein G
MPPRDAPQAEEEGRTATRVIHVIAAFVIVLIAALVGMSTMSDRAESGKRSVTIQRMNQIEDGLARYIVDSGGLLPTGTQGLQSLLTAPETGPKPANWNGPYVTGPGVLNDAWGNAFQYVVPGKPREGYEDLYHPYSLWSYGADGVEGGEKLDADICSWDRTTMIP